ncbi:MAG TPA: hypothetical protein VFW40_09435 [Capsulimonadaceae bacterium]|nr:hypothetical protein [Capsulimonadaceae bacterium]
MPTTQESSTKPAPTAKAARPFPGWKKQLASCFAELERRRTIAAQTQPISEDDFRRFVQNEAIPAFREFHSELVKYGDLPEYKEGKDWVGLRWQEGHWIDINPLMRAPNRAAATIDRARAYRERYGEESVQELLQLTKDDILRWLVLSYAAFRRVSESELEFPSDDHLPTVADDEI